MKRELNYNDISIEDIEKEIYREKYKYSFNKILRSTLSILLIIIAIVSVLTTLLTPVVEITSSNMNPLYKDGNIVLTLKQKTYKTGDIIAFYYGNKILVKRVIGTPGDTININIDGEVYLNGNKLEEKYITNFQRGNTNIEYPIQVTENEYFVLNDERTNTNDSRNTEIGNIKKEDIIGKIIIKIW